MADYNKPPADQAHTAINFPTQSAQTQRLSAGHALLNPHSGDPLFGRVPALKLAGLSHPECGIVLFHGRHVGRNRGYGACHIWKEHAKEMAAVGLNTEAEVALFVLRIIRPGTPLLFEAASWHHSRLLAVRSATGTAVLEFRDQREKPIWSVVTAFAGTKTHGTRVGAVR